MREFWLVFKQAFMTKAKTKSFIITTIIMVLALFLMANLNRVIDGFTSLTGGDETDVVFLVTEDEALYEQIIQTHQSGEHTFMFARDGSQSKEQLEAELKEEKFTGLLEVSQDEQQVIQATYSSMSVIDVQLPTEIETILQAVQTETQAKQLNLSTEQVSQLLTPVQMESKNISPTAKSDEEYVQATILVYVLMFVIYFAVIMYSSMIATEVATEKSSRVMEILISSISPVKHMFAKVLGIGMLGLLQLVTLGVAGFIAIRSNQTASTFTDLISFSEVSKTTLIYALVFFVLGYFLYATLAALLGSLVSRTEDVQQLIMPMTLLIVIAFIIAVTGLNNPEMALVTWASYFPFFTPLVMFLRVGLLDLPFWVPLLSVGIMLVTIFILGTFGARVYRGGVLMYGPSRSLKDIKKAIDLGKE